MSFFNLPKFSRSHSTRRRSRAGGRSSSTQSVRDLAFRRLRIDPLEDRRMLSLTVTNPTDMLVNNTTSLSSTATTVADGESTATDPSGDFVVTWSQTDTLSNGETESNIYGRYFTNEEERIFLPAGVVAPNGAVTFGQFTLRLFGNQGDVQEISITGGTDPSTGEVPPVAGTFGLTYDDPVNGTVSTGAITFNQLDAPSANAANIQSALQNAISASGGSAALAGVQVVALDSTDYLVDFPKGYCNLQGNTAAIAADPTASSLVATPLLQSDPTQYSFASGFLPGVLVSDYQEPVDVGPISVDPTSSTSISTTSGPGHTAALIEQAFSNITNDATFNASGQAYASTTTTGYTTNGNLYSEAPVLQADSVDDGTTSSGNYAFQTANRTTDSSTLFYPEGVTLGGGTGAADSPDTVISSPAQVQVTPEWDATGATTGTGQAGYSLTNFDITFVGITSDQDLSYTDADGNVHAALLVAQAQNYQGNSLTVAESDTQILKKPSPQFMVNDPDPVDSITGQQILFNKATPAVAMDANGEFVVTWQQYTVVNNDIGTQVPQIFAKRFVPSTFNQSDPISDVSAQGTAFEVNSTSDVNPKEKPAIGMDTQGDFVIAWNTIGQTLGFGNNVAAQRFDFQGDKVGSEFQVDPETGGTLADVKVAMSADGHFGIVYDLTNDDINYSVWASIYNAQGVQILPAPAGTTPGPQANVGGGGGPSIAFDANDDFAIGWNVLGTTGSVAADANNDGGTSVGVRAEEFSLAGGFGSPVDSTFRVNSSDLANPSANQMWSGAHTLSQVTFDANGDLVVGYQGSSPAVSEDASQIGASTFTEGGVVIQPTAEQGEAASALIDDYFEEPGNADLLALFGGVPPDILNINSGAGSGGSAQDIINSELITCIDGNPGVTKAQLGRVQAILEDALAPMLSDSGVDGAAMFSQFSNVPSTTGVKAQTNVSSDNLINATRSGSNATYYIDISSVVNGGTFNISVANTANGKTSVGTATVNGPGGNTAGPLTQPEIQATLNSIKAAIVTPGVTGPQDVGTNWTTASGNAGPVAVRWVSYAELADRVGTPWQIVAAANTNDYVFEVTFQDEVQATQMNLTIPTVALTEPSTPAVCDLQLNPAGVTATPAIYELKLNPASLPTIQAKWDLQLTTGTTNILQPTGNGATEGEMNVSVTGILAGTTTTTTVELSSPLYFNAVATGAASFAAQLASDLQSFDGGGETVTSNGQLGNTNWDFTILFGGASAGTVVTNIQDTPLISPAPGAGSTYGQFLASGFIPSTTDAQAALTGCTTGAENGQMIITANGSVLPYVLTYNPLNAGAFAGQLQLDMTSYGTSGLFGGGESVAYNGKVGTLDDYLITMGGASTGFNLTSLQDSPAVPTPLPAGNAQFPTAGFNFTSTPIQTYNRGIGVMNVTVAGSLNGTAVSQQLSTAIQYDPTQPQNYAGNLAGDLQGFEGGGETVVYNGTNLFDLKLNDAGVPNNGLDTGEMDITIVTGAAGAQTTTVYDNLNYDPWNVNGAGGSIVFATELQTDLQGLGAGATVTYNARNGTVDDYTVWVPAGVWIYSMKDTPNVATLGANQVQFAAKYFSAAPNSTSLDNGNILDDYTITFAGNSAGTAITSIQDAQPVNPVPTPPDYQFTPADFIYSLVTQGQLNTPPNPVVSQQVGNPLDTAALNPDAETDVNIAMEPSGSFVASWTQIDAAGHTEIYYRQFTDTTDTVGPVVTGVTLADGTPVTNNSRVSEVLGGSSGTELVVDFDEQIADADFISVNGSNPSNWELLNQSGHVVSGAIASVDFGMNEAYVDGLPGATEGNNTWQAVITFNGQLPAAQYTLVATTVLSDTQGNPLGRTAFTASTGVPFTLAFNTEATANPPPGNPTSGSTDLQVDSNSDDAETTPSPGLASAPVVATDSVGNYVVVWTDIQTTQVNGVYPTEIMAQRYNEFGAVEGNAFMVNTVTVGNRQQPSVAMDPDGDFVVVWSGYGPGDSYGIFARRFNAAGNPLDAAEFLVNTNTATLQQSPSVAVDPATEGFVISWTSAWQGGTQIFAEVYNSSGLPVGSPFQVGNTSNGSQGDSRVAMNAAGDFVITWQSDNSSTSGWDIEAQEFAITATGAEALGGAFGVNSYVANDQITPAVAMDNSGDYVIAWASNGEVASGAWSIYYREYYAAGGKTGEVLVTTNSANLDDEKSNPAVSMDYNGDFVVSWESLGQDNSAASVEGIYARVFLTANTTITTNPSTSEFLVNSTVVGNHVDPAVSMVSSSNPEYNGNFVAVWNGPAGIALTGLATTNGSTTVTVNNASALLAGMTVTGPGIPAGATITSVTNGTTFVLNTAATVTATGGTATAAAVVVPAGYGPADWIYARLVGLADPPVATVKSPLGTTVGTYNPATSTFYLKTSNTSGAATEAVTFGVPGAGWQPLNGDWAGNGTQTIGLYNPATSIFYLKNSDTAGAANTEFQFGSPGKGSIALVGDWTGSGKDTVGLYDPATSTFYLKYSNSAGPANAVFTFGPANSGWIPIVGDWNGSGDDEVGLYDPTTSVFYLRETNTAGSSDKVVAFGQPNAGLLPVVGDWLGTGVSGIGLYNPATGSFMLQNSTSASASGEVVTFASAGSGALPSVAQWQSGELQVAAAPPPQSTADAATVAPLTESELQPIVAAAIERWQAAGASTSQVAAMEAVHFYVGSLPGNELGTTVSQRAVYIDATADGYGWFVDPTPQSDASFQVSKTDGQLHAVSAAAVDEIDLLTVVEHELGHVIGLPDSSSVDTLMSETLPAGVRRDAATDELFGSSALDDLT